jgi:hypothetical protein
MKKLSSNFLRTTRLAYLALAAVAGSQAVHAQVVELHPNLTQDLHPILTHPI